MATKKKTEKEFSADKTKKGYNERNPTQPQGAFKPDNTQTKAKDAKSNAADLHKKSNKKK